jgi:hypothetical protein
VILLTCGGGTVENPRPNRAGNLIEQVLKMQRFGLLAGFDVDDCIADFGIRPQVFADDVDLAFGEDGVYPG